MDSYLVSTMVQGHQHQTQSKKLHPFFSKEATNASETPSPLAASSYDDSPQSSMDYNVSEDNRRKRRKTDGLRTEDVVEPVGRSAMSNVEPNVQPTTFESVEETKERARDSDTI